MSNNRITLFFHAKHKTTWPRTHQIMGASVICKQSVDANLAWMIKREFKAMHSLFSNISRVRKDVGNADVPIHVPPAQAVPISAEGVE